ncbi:hypothetical protein FDENT_13940 [Fusarium denticulatum]|uniref:Uncharacterized protein n=1 Tax=Fusarium denticulatum TaxID=48507 RepID=A0A8H5WGN7_9HYPO|nr:hypothetical protein FDENT_13940 [Fusarium denticulatum]
MPVPISKRSSTILNDCRPKKRAKQSNDDEGITAQEGSTVRPPELSHAKANSLVLDVSSSPLPEIIDGYRQLPNSRHVGSKHQSETVQPDVTANSEARASIPPEAYDICFGMLMVKATCTQSNLATQECNPVTLDFEGRLLRVREENSNRRIAVVVSNALFRLVNEFAVTLTANICGKKPPIVYTSKKKGQTISEIDGIKFCSLRIVVYGFVLQKDEISAILAQDELFLQHPGKTEFDRTVRHQVEALVMMIEKEAGVYENAQFPAIWVPHTSPRGEIRYQNIVTETFKMSRPPPISGGILADEMGLGKTLSTLSLICHFLDEKEKRPDKVRDQPRGTLIVTPKSTIYSWEKQIKTWVEFPKLCWQWKVRDILTSHKIRNSSSQIFAVMSKLQTQSRWCLTGTPIQNSLDDFGALLAFIKIPPFETAAHFDHYVINPIKKNRRKGFSMLRKVVAATCLRRTKATYGQILNLPQKTERVDIIDMGREDRRLYEFFKRFSYLTAGLDKISKKKPATNILVLISMLRLICNHGEALLPEAALKAWKEKDSSVLSWEVLEANIKRCISCKFEIEESGTAISLTEDLPCGHTMCSRCASKSQSSASLAPCLECRVSAGSQAIPIIGASLSQSEAMNGHASKPKPPPSAKVQALIRNISRAEKGPESRVDRPKSVVFSYWTKMLDLIGFALNSQGFQFQRIDGQSSMSQRKAALETFGSDPEYNVMLASIGAAGEGIDLTSASIVHIVEPHWNPMAEAQAVDRVHRIGQQKDVYVIRYIANDSIEQYVQWMQRDKQRLITESLSISEEKPQDVDEVRWKKLIEFLE